ncbi:uncharacterized protein Dwil_GK21429 [Drosophila willistoni]|nr:UDP-glycosyltransferase UGT5 [Drosophila willistoni]EDW74351.2 uncharacterized protein Dwil_GK21429 [Drosophila willistoni]
MPRLVEFGLFLILFVSCQQFAKGAKILLLFPHASESHFAVMRTLVTELATREHNVTLYTSHGLHEQLETVTEHIIPEYPFWSKLQEHAAPKGKLEDLAKLPLEKLRKSLAHVGAASLDHFLGQKKLQTLLKLSYMDFDYDLIIVDYFYSEALLALGFMQQKPVMGIVSSDFGQYMEAVQESLVPTGCSPIDFENYSPHWDFLERLGNIRECIARRKDFEREHYGAQEKLIEKHFKVQTSVAELQAFNLAVLLINNHVPLLTPRPLIQQIVLAGGLHIRGPRELPWNVKKFLEEARSGVVYLQLGNEQPCGQLSDAKKKILFDLFKSRKQSFIWSCHDVKKLKDLPENALIIQHSVPQIDILAHPRVRAFIMNGDLLSLQEGISRNVPMVGLPCFQNEQKNMQLAVRLGVGLQLNQDNVTTPSLNWALDRLLTEQHFHLTIRDVSMEYRDRPLGALATAVFWVNYVVRHKGGAAIRTRGIGISSSQLHLFDLFVFYFGVAVLITALAAAVYFIGFFLWQRKNKPEKLAKAN